MEKQILQELKQIKAHLAELMGTSHLDPESQFSKEALDRVGRLFRKMNIKRMEWVDEYDIVKFIPSAEKHGVGKFIRDEFGFNACIKKSYHFQYNRKALMALNKELEKRNIQADIWSIKRVKLSSKKR